MPSNVQFDLVGFKELVQAMNDLPKKTSDSVLKAFNRKVAKKYIVDGMKSSLPYSPRQKSRVIITSVKGDKTAVSAGFSTSAKWVRWNDLGTKERYTKAGAYRGQIVGRNRVQPFIERQVPAIIKEFNDEFGNEIIKTIQKRMKSAQRKLTKLGG